MQKLLRKNAVEMGINPFHAKVSQKIEYGKSIRVCDLLTICKAYDLDIEESYIVPKDGYYYLYNAKPKNTPELFKELKAKGFKIK